MQLLHPKEEEIMATIWDIGQPCVISDILNSNANLKRNTVSKILIVLVNKEYLITDTVLKTATRYGRAYKPIVSRETYEQQKKLFNTVEKSSDAQKGVLSFISTLVDTDKIDNEFIEDMERLLEEFKSKAGNT